MSRLPVDQAPQNPYPDSPDLMSVLGWALMGGNLPDLMRRGFGSAEAAPPQQEQPPDRYPMRVVEPPQSPDLKGSDSDLMRLRRDEKGRSGPYRPIADTAEAAIPPEELQRRMARMGSFANDAPAQPQQQQGISRDERLQKLLEAVAKETSLSSSKESAAVMRRLHELILQSAAQQY